MAGNQEAETVFCAFIDVLGFKNIMDDWDEAIRYYDTLVANIFPRVVSAQNLIYHHVNNTLKSDIDQQNKQHVSWRIVSDSIILTSHCPMKLIQVAGSLQYYSFLFGYWIRGGIAFGRHIENFDGNNFFVVSEALSRAYFTESNISIHPRIAIHPSALVRIEESLFKRGNGLLLPIESHWLIQGQDNHWFVNPFIFRPDQDIPGFAKSIEYRLGENSRSSYMQKYSYVADLHNFITTYVLMLSRWEDYYSEPQYFISYLKQLQSNDPLNQLIKTWDFSDSFETFFQPRVLPFSPTRGNIRVLFSSSPYKMSFNENVQAWPEIIKNAGLDVAKLHPLASSRKNRENTSNNSCSRED